MKIKIKMNLEFNNYASKNSWFWKLKNEWVHHEVCRYEIPENFQLIRPSERPNHINAWQTWTCSVCQSTWKDFIFQSKSLQVKLISDLFLAQSLLIASCTNQLVGTTFCWSKKKKENKNKAFRLHGVETCKIMNQEPDHPL